MKELVRLVRTLKLYFTLSVLLLLLYGILSLSGIINLVIPLEGPDTRYVCEVAGVLMTLLIVPFSLKFFNKFFNSKVMTEQSMVKAMRRYCWLSMVRLTSLFIVAAYNLVLYFSVSRDSSIGILCFFISLISFAFCVPTEGRIKNDLNLEDLDLNNQR